MSERLQHLCSTGVMAPGDRTALLKRFGRIAAAPSVGTIQRELGKLRDTLVRCIDAHLSSRFTTCHEPAENVRELLLSDDLGAEPGEVLDMVQPDTPAEFTASVHDLLAIVQAVEEFERTCRNGGVKHIRRTATNASIAIANYDRESADEPGNDRGEPPEDSDAPAQDNGGRAEPDHFYRLSGFRGANDATPLLQLLSHTQPSIEGSPLLISRALYILSTTQVNGATEQEHAARVERLCIAGQRMAGAFRPAATSSSLLGLAKMPYPVNGQSKPFVLSLLQNTVEQSRTLDAATIRTSLWSLARMGYPFGEVRTFVEYACRQGIECIQEFHTPQTSSNCIASLGDMGAQGSAVDVFVEALCTRGVQILGQREQSLKMTFSTQEISSSLRGLAKIGTGGEAVDTFLRLATQEMHNQMEAAEPRHLAGTMHALAKRVVLCGDRHIRQWGETQAFFAALCERASVSSMNARDMTEILWALATMGHSFTDAFAEDMHLFVRALCGEAATRIAQNGDSVKIFQPQEISVCLWALAHLGTEGEEVQQFIDAAYAYGERNISNFSEQNANNSCWGLAVLSHRYTVPRQGKVFLDRATELLDADRPESVRQLNHANLALTHTINIPLYYRVCEQDFRELFGNRMLTGSKEDALVRWLRTGEDAPHFLSNMPLHGFQCDILSNDTEVNVEIDGPHHEDRREIDAFRDRLLAALGMQVIRIPEEMVDDVRDDIRSTLLLHQ
ncbi:MAG: hypothetical protein UY85_C0016G0002 [Candidatus Peribacteria bacterium GW2011_GWB1_54_5]|nr:MAG: hypothetical protein UY85_C0016G0002 [Candidatus Peribacteria bacterium GW2011_GWB1_54_5]